MRCCVRESPDAPADVLRAHEASEAGEQAGTAVVYHVRGTPAVKAVLPSAGPMSLFPATEWHRSPPKLRAADRKEDTLPAAAADTVRTCRPGGGGVAEP